MKILWIKTDFLHPTTRGGQIRTLEMLRCLHRKHEIHYVCLDDGTDPEGPARYREYATEAYPVRHAVPPRRSLRFAGQLATGLFTALPVSVSRYRSAAMRRKLVYLLSEQSFDSIVCDFPFPAANVPDLGQAILFEHNVEAVIWERHVEQAKNGATRRYLALQARRMARFEGEVCRRARHVVAVSEVDREAIRNRYGVKDVTAVGTGVNMPSFARPDDIPFKADLVFTGSMDWLPNIDAMKFFAAEILPRILIRRPGCRIAIVGRRPTEEIRQLQNRYSNIAVTGTVEDIRPWLWGSTAAIVPLRIGGGTRLKIFEAMAAGIPVVATAVGAEGLPVETGRHLIIADDAERFAEGCFQLLDDQRLRERLTQEARSLVAGRFSWDAVTWDFEQILLGHAGRGAARRTVYV